MWSRLDRIGNRELHPMLWNANGFGAKALAQLPLDLERDYADRVNRDRERIGELERELKLRDEGNRLAQSFVCRSPSSCVYRVKRLHSTSGCHPVIRRCINAKEPNHAIPLPWCPRRERGRLILGASGNTADSVCCRCSHFGKTMSCRLFRQSLVEHLEDALKKRISVFRESGQREAACQGDDGPSLEDKALELNRC